MPQAPISTREVFRDFPIGKLDVLRPGRRRLIQRIRIADAQQTIPSSWQVQPAHESASYQGQEVPGVRREE